MKIKRLQVLFSCYSVRLGIKGLLVRDKMPAESLYCDLEQDSLSTA